MLECNDHWYVLRTKSQHENIVESSLEQKCINVFLPRRKVVRRLRNRTRVLNTALFPGYVFVQPRIEQYESIHYIPGSCGLVYAGDKPAPVPESQLEAVKILVQSEAMLTVNPQLFAGQKVEVVAGPLTGVQGELIRVKNQQRLVINAHLLNSSVSVEVDVHEIRVL
jgi:transcription antitermination factor NusG